MTNGLAALQPLISQSLASSPSPLARWLNGTLYAVHSDGIAVAFVVREEMTNPAGVLHGGIISAMLDEVIGMTLIVMTGDYHASINFSVDFLNSARQDDQVICESHVVRQGRSVVHAEGRVISNEGKLLARATTNLLRKV